MSEQSMMPAPSAIEDLDNPANPILAMIAGVAAMLIGAVIWAAISYFTNYQIGWLCIGIGFLIGIAIRRFGRGNSVLYGVLGAVLALIAVVLGNLLFYSGVIADQEGMSFAQVLFLMVINPGATLGIFSEAFELIDVLFYGLAVYTGFRYSFQPS